MGNTRRMRSDIQRVGSGLRVSGTIDHEPETEMSRPSTTRKAVGALLVAVLCCTPSPAFAERARVLAIVYEGPRLTPISDAASAVTDFGSAAVGQSQGVPRVLRCGLGLPLATFVGLTTGAMAGLLAAGFSKTNNFGRVARRSIVVGGVVGFVAGAVICLK